MYALVNTTNPLNGESSQTIFLFNGNSQFYDKNGIGYAPSYLQTWTAQEKKDRGIYEVVYGTTADDRFYNIVENPPTFANDTVTVTYTCTAKELEDGPTDEITGRSTPGLKTVWIKNVKTSANLMLSNTDWAIVRKIERDIDIPANIVSYRASVVAESNRLETAILGASDVEELISAVKSANWPAQE